MEEDVYVNTLAYAIEQTARVYRSFMQEHFLEVSDGKLTLDEFIILDMLVWKPDLYQMDLARLTLKGRAHIGKFIDSLETKGYVKRDLSSKDKKMIKKLIVTKKGMTIFEYTRNNAKKTQHKVEHLLADKDVQILKKHLKSIRDTLLSISDLKFI